jgi:hypothetical protein
MPRNEIDSHVAFTGGYSNPLVIGASSLSSAAAAVGKQRSVYGKLDDISVWKGQLTSTRVRALFNLGNDPVLNYGAADEQTLADVFASQGIGTTSDGNVWQYATGLAGNPGDVLDHNAIILDGEGNGVQIVPSRGNLDSTSLQPRIGPDRAATPGASPTPEKTTTTKGGINSRGA